MQALELHVTYRCNVKCNNCSNLCTQAPAILDLSVEDVQKLCDESVACDYPWQLITLHGGEPSLHPKILEILKVLIAYKHQHNPRVRLWVLSNDAGMKVKETLVRIAAFGVPIGRAPKKVGSANINHHGDKMEYVPVNESPIDINEPYTLGCFQPRDCGIAYNKFGFYECSPAASAARVFGYPPIAKTVSELDQGELEEGYKEHCRHCGFSMPERRRVTEQLTTPTWQKAFDLYNLTKGVGSHV